MAASNRMQRANEGGEGGDSFPFIHLSQIDVDVHDKGSAFGSGIMIFVERGVFLTGSFRLCRLCVEEEEASHHFLWRVRGRGLSLNARLRCHSLPRLPIGETLTQKTRAVLF